MKGKKAIAILLITVFIISTLAVAIPVSADTLTVGTGKTYATITLALAAAVDGDVIEVYAGTYTEDLTITVPNLELVAAEAGVTIKGVSNVPEGDWPLAAANINILADEVKIHGFNIEGPDYVANYYSSGMVIGGADIEIYENDFEATGAETTDEISQTIQTYHGPYDVSGLNIHDNTFTALADSNYGFEAIYVNLDGGTGTVYISDNNFTGEVFRAITTERSNTVISGNRLDTSVADAWQGILVRDYTAAQVLVDVTGNTIEGFAQGILIGCTGQTLIDIEVKGNTILSNDVGVKVRSSASGVYVNDNDILDNNIGVENIDSAELNAEYNWWGTTGLINVGEMVSGLVDFTPYLSAAIDDPEAEGIGSNPELDSALYKTGDAPIVTVYDWVANEDKIRIEDISIDVTSTTDTVGFSTKLTETGIDTGLFTGSFPLVEPVDPGDKELGVNDGDTIIVKYKATFGFASIDDSVPEITVDQPDVQIISVSSIEVTGSYIEPNIDTITVNGVLADIDKVEFTFSVTLVSLVYGNNTLTAIATDVPGYTSSDSTWVVYDNLGPVVADALATPLKAIAKGKTDLSVKVTDEWVDVKFVKVDLTDIGGSDTQAMDLDEGLWEYTATVGADIEDGVYYLNITAEDDLDNQNTIEFFVFEVVTDTVPPVMGAWAVDYPIEKTSAREGDEVKVGVIATDLPAGVSYVEINGTEITGVPELVEMAQIGSPNYYYTYLTVISDVPDGIYYLNITATDYAGNKASTLAEVLIQELATMEMYTLSADYDPGDTVDFYVKASFAFNLTIEIVDPTNFPYKTIKCIEDKHWIRVGDNSIVPYQASFDLPGTAVSGTWNWTALEGDKEVSDGTFAVGVTYTGTLSINTTPFGGEVFVDDEFWGMAPVEQEVEVGSYTVSFGAVEGYTTPASQEVVVTKDTTTEIEGIYIEIVVETGTLSITTAPVMGEVFVEGLTWGDAPQSQEVDVGTYDVSFGDVDGYITPSDEEAVVTVDATTDVEGTYVEIPELPAETTEEETLDSNGNPKTSFVSGETVLVSADICNVGHESQTMLIVIQLTDPDLRVLPPLYIQITLLPGQSIIPAIGFALPTTGYATGTWTAKIMVLDGWPAQGGVPIGPPVIITFTVS